MNVFKLDFRSQLRGGMLWTGIMLLVLILFMAFFPSMQSKAMQDLVGVKLDSLPPVMLEAFGLEDIPDFTQVSTFYAYIMQYINMAAAVYAALLGSSALIKEETEGTIEYLYAQPVTRGAIVVQKILSAVATYTLFTAVIGLASIGVAILVKPAGTELIPLVTDMKMVLAGMYFVGLIFMALGFLASVMLSSVRLTASFSLGVVFTSFILGILGAAVDELSFMQHISPLDAVKPNKLLNSGFDTAFIVAGLMVIIISTALTFYIYQRKDLRS